MLSPLLPVLLTLIVTHYEPQGGEGMAQGHLASEEQRRTAAISGWLQSPELGPRGMETISCSRV